MIWLIRVAERLHLCWHLFRALTQLEEAVDEEDEAEALRRDLECALPPRRGG